MADKYGFIFSENPEDWYGKSREKEKERQYAREKYRQKKEQENTPPTRSRFHVLNDQLRQR